VNRFYYAKDGQLLAIGDRAGILKVSAAGVRKLYPADSSFSLFGMIETKRGGYLAIADKFMVIAYDHLFRPTRKILFDEAAIPNTIHEDLAGNIWIGTEGGLHLLSHETKLEGAVKWSALPPVFHNTALATVTINDILEDPDHTLWFGTNEGLYKLTAGGKIELYNENDGLPSRKVTSIFRDR
jgi:hypothetical protein